MASDSEESSYDSDLSDNHEIPDTEDEPDTSSSRGLRPAHPAVTRARRITSATTLPASSQSSHATTVSTIACPDTSEESDDSDGAGGVNPFHVRAPSKMRSDPDQPVQHDSQGEMEFCFDHEGYLGLARCYQDIITRIAPFEHDPTWNKHWADICKAIESRATYFEQMLYTLSPTEIRSIIRNTWTWDKNRQNRLRTGLKAEDMETDGTPGIYVMVFCCNADPLDPHWGKFLTRHEVGWLVEDIRHYVKSSPSDPLVTKMDTWKRSNSQQATRAKRVASMSMWQRRYIKKASQQQRLTLMATILERCYMHNVDPLKWDDPFERCLYNCGWASNVAQRTNDHKFRSQGSSRTFAFLDCWLRHILPTKGSDNNYFAEAEAAQLFRMTFKSDAMAKCGEWLGSILSSSFTTLDHRTGGLNYFTPGGVIWSADLMADDNTFKRNMRAIQARGTLKAGIEFDHRKMEATKEQALQLRFVDKRRAKAIKDLETHALKGNEKEDDARWVKTVKEQAVEVLEDHFRRHPPPKVESMQDIVARMKKHLDDLDNASAED
ncbi:hypothetical protein MMC25_004412 [Agyrium rufum]|nr:hypothetical protein [Agyrium rufum]